jgi:two-component sensor histidine kinase
MKTLSLYDFVNQKKIASHLFFLTLAAVSAFLFRVFRGTETPPADLASIFVMIFVQVEVFIYVGNLLFSKLNFDRRPGIITRIILFRFIIFLVACLVVSMFLYLILKFVVTALDGGELDKVIPDFFGREWHEWFRSTARGLTFGGVIFVVLLWQTSLRREQKLREENLIFQNETLKNQVNPHFLFNNLNTISSLIQSQPDEAERFINDLSSIYRYILENGQKDRVPLASELQFISDYYKLHRTRDEEKILLSVDVPDAGKYEILPVSLQTLLENAIKHNIATRDNKLRIFIRIENDYIVVTNNLQRKATSLKSTGTGLKNLGERLKLITGKEMKIEEDDSTFTVKLPLLI